MQGFGRGLSINIYVCAVDISTMGLTPSYENVSDDIETNIEYIYTSYNDIYHFERFKNCKPFKLFKCIFSNNKNNLSVNIMLKS